MDARFAPVWRYYPRIIWATFRAMPKGSRFRHLFNVNPALGPTDLFGCSKVAIASLFQELELPQPEHIFIEIGDGSIAERALLEMLERCGCLIAKPEFGARSKGIVLLESAEQVLSFVGSKRRCRYLVQRFVFGEEVSALFSRSPGSQMEIQSLVERKKFSVVGDGKKTIRQFVSSFPEARVVSKLLEIHDGDEVIPEGQTRLLTVLGIHSMGSTFHKVPEMPWWVHEVEKKISLAEGVNYCRLDIIQNLDSRDYWVLELNGAHAEPLSAYEEPIDSEKFYQEFQDSMLSRIEIGKQVEDGGVTTPTSFEALRLIIRWMIGKD